MNRCFCFPQVHTDNCTRIKEVSPVYILQDSNIPLARAKPIFSRRKIYDSQNAEKMIMGIHLRNQHGDREPYNGILHLDLSFNFPFPREKNEERRLRKQIYHTNRPDLSNLQKMIEDVCVNAEIIKDDRFIASATIIKRYSPQSQVVFQFTVLKDHDEI